MDNLKPELPTLPEPEESKGAVEERQDKHKAALVEQLKKLPIIQAACERVGIARATFYRWKKDDKEFAEAVEQAVNDGTGLMNDLAESQLLSCIKDRDFSAIAFWLKHRHPAYAAKLEITTKAAKDEEPPTEEENEAVNTVMKLGGLEGGSYESDAEQSPE